MRIKRKYLVLSTIACAIVALDQLTKMYIHTHFGVGDTVTVIGNFFNITYVRNTGAAFGVFRQSRALFHDLFFLSMPPIAMIVILAMLRGVDDSDRWQIFSLSLIFGGAIGNYVDRLRFGYVVDFLDFHHGSWSYPAFNIADSAIVTGVCLLLLLMFLRDRAAKKSAREQKA